MKDKEIRLRSSGGNPRNAVADIIKVVVWTQWICGFIGGIIAGNSLGRGDFSIGIAIAVWIVSFVSGFGFYAFAEIISLLARIASQTYTGDLSEKSDHFSSGTFAAKDNSTEHGKDSATDTGFDPGRASKKVILRDKKYYDGPVSIRTATLLTAESGTALKIRIRNISTKVISAVKLELMPKDAFGESLGREFQYVFMDLNAAPGDFLGTDELIMLPSIQTRDVDIRIEVVKFSDESLWKRENLHLIDDKDNKEQGFGFYEHEDEIRGKKSAGEIYQYLNNNMPLGEDRKEILPKIKTLADSERGGFNLKTAAINALEEYYKNEYDSTPEEWRKEQEPEKTVDVPIETAPEQESPEPMPEPKSPEPAPEQKPVEEVPEQKPLEETTPEETGTEQNPVEPAPEQKSPEPMPEQKSPEPMHEQKPADDTPPAMNPIPVAATQAPAAPAPAPETEIVFCAQCGTKIINPKALFCTVCGRPVIR